MLHMKWWMWVVIGLLASGVLACLIGNFIYVGREGDNEDHPEER